MYFSADKLLIASKIKVFVYIVSKNNNNNYYQVYCVYLLCIYIKIHTNACTYLRKICYVYILNIFIENINYMNINIYMYIFSKYACVYLYT